MLWLPRTGHSRHRVTHIAATEAQEVSAAAEEMSAQVEEMTARVEEMTAQAEELSATADQPRVLAARFRTDAPSQVEAPHVRKAIRRVV